MTYTEAEHYIHSFTRFGSQLGLKRMRKLLKLMGSPQRKLHFVHIAGTNGKGSTAKMTAGILKEAGYTVGMYISPFVVNFRERFQVNGRMISRAEFAELADFVAPFVRQLAAGGDQVTEFEVITAIAFEFFHRRRCDIVALEVGLGGRFDATNIIRKPDCAVICSISLDHTEILGNTIAKIAFEKAGIIKKDTDVVTYPLQEPDAMAVLLKKCSKTGSRLIVPNAGAVEIKECDMLGSRFLYGGEEYQLGLVGTHQIYNAVAVIEAAKILRGKGFSITKGALRRGLKNARFPARFEIMSRHPLIIVDGAHNRQAAASLAETVSKLEAEPRVAVMGMMADKDYTSAIHSMSTCCDSLVCVPVPSNPRAASPITMAHTALADYYHVCAIEDYEDALNIALYQAGDNGAIIVCGSFYMASDMRPVISAWLRKQQAGEKK